jgi:peroxiredoxin (alkyl hydroperoxide reductase subunit C)
MIKVTERAPEFELEALADGEFRNVSLNEYKGKWVVLFFWPLDFTFVCPTEIRSFNELYQEFRELNSEVLGVSVDSVYSHKAWVENGLGEVRFPLLSDFNKKVSRMYGILVEEQGVALRGTFIIDPEGYLRYVVVSDLNVGRSARETLRVLEAFQTGELCPVDWQPGEKTLGKA